MPKRSGYAIALGLHGPPGTATNKESGSSRPWAVESRNAAEGLYFQLETFLDNWRRQGMPENVVRDALERAKHTSLAMENVGQWLTGR